MLVELKNGETLNGHLVLCDTWMNLTLREVVQTSPVGFPLVDRQWVADGRGLVLLTVLV
jgi:small nuclear ribonucleoprotein (snRNP)-like protein